MPHTKEQHAEYSLNLYHKLMKEARDFLGGVCVRCGTQDNLEFDHVDPATKEFTISHGWSFATDRFWLEVAKCQLLCLPHHKEKTLLETWGWALGEGNVNSKLLEVDVRNLRALYRLGRTQRSLAREFGVSRATINSILVGTTWGWLENEEPITLRTNEKLTEEDVREIRILAETGQTLSSIGRMFGIGKSHVSMVVRRKIWAQIE